MTVRKPLVFGADGIPQQLQTGDTINANAFFTAAATPLPAVTLLGPSTVTLTVTPRQTGDSLAAGEIIVVTPASALPAGLNIAYAIATATNTVVIGLSSTLSVTASSMAWTVVAQR